MTLVYWSTCYPGYYPELHEHWCINVCRFSYVLLECMYFNQCNAIPFLFFLKIETKYSHLMDIQRFTTSLFEHSWITIWATGRSVYMSHSNDHYNPLISQFLFFVGELWEKGLTGKSENRKHRRTKLTASVRSLRLFLLVSFERLVIILFFIIAYSLFTEHENALFKSVL